MADRKVRFRTTACPQVNEEKYAALGRLYGGLRVLALLFGCLVLLGGLSSVLGSLGGTR